MPNLQHGMWYAFNSKFKHMWWLMGKLRLHNLVRTNNSGSYTDYVYYKIEMDVLTVTLIEFALYWFVRFLNHRATAFGCMLIPKAWWQSGTMPFKRL